MYGLNTIYIDFTMGSLNPYEITPPQAIRAMPISRELQLARQKPLHRCAPLVHAVIWIYFVLTYSTDCVLNCPKVEFDAFSWNQLVFIVRVFFDPTSFGISQNTLMLNIVCTHLDVFFLCFAGGSAWAKLPTRVQGGAGVGNTCASGGEGVA